MADDGDIVVVASRRFDSTPLWSPQIIASIENLNGQLLTITQTVAEANLLSGKFMMQFLEKGISLKKEGKYYGKDFSDLSMYETSLELGSKKLKIYFDNKELNENQIASILQKLQTGTSNFALQAYGSQEANKARDYLNSLDSIIFTDNVGRSGTHLSTKTFILGYTDQNLGIMTPGVLLNMIMHDGFHEFSFENGKPSYGIDAEISATKAQIEMAKYFGLTDIEIKYLNDYMNDRDAIDKRINTPYKPPQD